MMKKLLNLENSYDKFLFLFLNNEFEKLNISLSEKQLDELVRQIFMPNIKSIVLDLTESLFQIKLKVTFLFIYFRYLDIRDKQ